MPEPNLFIVGAPRSGTTTLSELLKQHPQVFFPKLKEPHYFLSIKVPESARKIHQMVDDEGAYLKLFKGAERYKYCADASTHYLSDHSVAAKLREFSPEARIIIILREPVERAYSHYLLSMRWGDKGEAFDRIIEDNIKKIGDSDHLFNNIVEIGMYADQIEKYLLSFAAESVLILEFEALKNDPQPVLRQIEAFLDIGPHSYQPITSPSNAFRVARFGFLNEMLKSGWLLSLASRLPRGGVKKVRQMLLKSTEKPDMDSATRARLADFYAPHNRRLQDLLGREFFRNSTQ